MAAGEVRPIEIPDALFENIKRVYHMDDAQAEQSLKRTALYRAIETGSFQNAGAEELFGLYQDEVEYGKIVKTGDGGK